MSINENPITARRAAGLRRWAARRRSGRAKALVECDRPAWLPWYGTQMVGRSILLTNKEDCDESKGVRDAVGGVPH